MLAAGLSPASIHRLARQVTELHLEQERGEIEDAYEHGVLRPTKARLVPYLLGKADGTNITLSRGTVERAEVEIGIAYEGWEETDVDWHRVKAKAICRGTMDVNGRLVTKCESSGPSTGLSYSH